MGLREALAWVLLVGVVLTTGWEPLMASLAWVGAWVVQVAPHAWDFMVEVAGAGVDAIEHRAR